MQGHTRGRTERRGDEREKMRRKGIFSGMNEFKPGVEREKEGEKKKI